MPAHDLKGQGPNELRPTPSSQGSTPSAIHRDPIFLEHLAHRRTLLDAGEQVVDFGGHHGVSSRPGAGALRVEVTMSLGLDFVQRAAGSPGGATVLAGCLSVGRYS